MKVLTWTRWFLGWSQGDGNFGGSGVKHYDVQKATFVRV